MAHATTRVEVAPLQRDGRLGGFLLAGRWPDSTMEWLRVLLLAVQVAAMPGMLPTTTVFRTREDLPADPPEGAVGLLMAEGPVQGSDALAPGQLADPPPSCLVVLHPPEQTIPSLPEIDRVASGCLLLPGLPHLGLEHRAGWIQAAPDGTMTTLVTRAGVDPADDADTAVLAMLLDG